MTNVERSPDPTGRGLVDVAGAADYLGVTEAFIRRLVLEERVRYYKVGRLVRFRPADLDSLVEAGRIEPMDRPARHRSAPARRPRLGNR